MENIIKAIGQSRYYVWMFREYRDVYHELLDYFENTKADAETILWYMFSFGAMAGIRDERERRRGGGSER